MPVPGGAPANAAVAAARLGAKSAFIGKVGDEAFGHHLSDVLAAEGVDVRGVRFDTRGAHDVGLHCQAGPGSRRVRLLPQSGRGHAAARRRAGRRAAAIHHGSSTSGC